MIKMLYWQMYPIVELFWKLYQILVKLIRISLQQHYKNNPLALDHIHDSMKKKGKEDLRQILIINTTTKFDRIKENIGIDEVNEIDIIATNKEITKEN